MSGLSEEIFQEGFKQDIEKERKRIVQRFLNFGKMTLEEIAIMLDMPVAEVQNYIKNN